jgi:hypothetical protein
MIIEQNAPQEERPSDDMRQAMMMLPVEHQTRLMVEYQARRKNFRDWLLSQLVEGVHFGFPPGCEPKSQVRNDGITYYAVWMRGKTEWYPETQWKPKPPLYAAGADFVCDLLGVRAEFQADMQAWEQLGSKQGTFVMACYLKSRANNDLIGEGRGVRAEGDKKGDANNATKMAEKAAKVDAVINAYGLRDLFTQEEESKPTPNVNPDAAEGAPQEQPRGYREAGPTPEEVKELVRMWQARNPEPNGDKAAWAANYKQWVMKVTDRVFYPTKASNWNQEDYRLCKEALA